MLSFLCLLIDVDPFRERNKWLIGGHRASGAAAGHCVVSQIGPMTTSNSTRNTLRKLTCHDRCCLGNFEIECVNT